MEGEESLPSYLKGPRKTVLAGTQEEQQGRPRSSVGLALSVGLVT